MAEIPLKIWLIIALTAIIGGFMANLIYFHILKKNNSAIVAALTYSSPIFVLLLSVLFLKEPIHPITVIGILTAVFGVVLISYGSHISHEDLEMQTYV
jgi:drug/metabolite transporter (DMT)-like permease